MQLVESCWVEIDPCNGKAPVFIRSIYKHPGANIEEFTKHFDDLIIKLQNRYQLYILGDMNIDFLKYNDYTQTEESRELRKQFSKPWITNGILKSIKNKQSIYRTHFLSNNPKKSRI